MVFHRKKIYGWENHAHWAVGGLDALQEGPKAAKSISWAILTAETSNLACRSSFAICDFPIL